MIILLITIVFFLVGFFIGKKTKKGITDFNQDYIMPENADHRKQRGRTAPNRALNKKDNEGNLES